jgi:RNA polymerase sigma-70 factor (ECF subfamily)
MALPTSPPRGEPFPPTAWDRVRAAATDPDALNHLLAAYRGPLVEYLRRALRVPETDAEDLVHRFIAERVLVRGDGGGLLGRADEGRGRFRTYLLTALDHFVTDCRRAAGARKEAPNRAAELADDPAARSADHPAVFDIALGLKLLGLAIRRLEESCRAAGRPDHWGLFEGRILVPVCGEEATPFAALAARWGFTTEKQAANAFQTAQNRFRRCWAGVLAEHLGADPLAEGDVLIDALGQAGPALLDGLCFHLWGELPGVTGATGRPHFGPGLGELVKPVAVRPTDPGVALQSALTAPAWFETGDLAPPLAARLGALGGAPVRTSFAELLRHPAPGVELLSLAKDFAKGNRADPDSPLGPEAATALYYAAIAAARVRHGAAISGQDPAAVRAGLRWVAAQPWVNAEVRALAAAAAGGQGC